MWAHTHTHTPRGDMWPEHATVLTWPSSSVGSSVPLGGCRDLCEGAIRGWLPDIFYFGGGLCTSNRALTSKCSHLCASSSNVAPMFAQRLAERSNIDVWDWMVLISHHLSVFNRSHIAPCCLLTETCTHLSTTKRQKLISIFTFIWWRVLIPFNQ